MQNSTESCVIPSLPLNQNLMGKMWTKEGVVLGLADPRGFLACESWPRSGKRHNLQIT